MKERYCGFFAWVDDDHSSNNEDVFAKVAALEAKIVELEAVKNMEIGELKLQLKMKDAELSFLKWLKFGFTIIFVAFVWKLCFPNHNY